MHHAIPCGEVRSVIFLRAGPAGEVIIVDEYRGFDRYSRESVALCGACYGPVALFESAAIEGQVLHCPKCGLRIAMPVKVKKPSEIIEEMQVVRKNVCGRCVGSRQITVTPHFHGTANPVQGFPQRLTCPQCKGSGEMCPSD